MGLLKLVWNGNGQLNITKCVQCVFKWARGVKREFYKK